MPKSEIHKERKFKNYLVLAILIIIVALFFSVTLVRLSG